MMRLKFIEENYKHNLKLAKDKCSELGVDCSVMVKDFINKAPYYNMILNSDFDRIWARGIQGDNVVNYKVGDVDNAIQSGVDCVVTTKEELQQLHYKGKRKFNVYIPVGYFEVREGVSVVEASDLVEYSKKSLNVNVVGLMANAGCANNRKPTYEDIEDFVFFANELGITKVSLGGSMFLDYPKLPKGVTELRIGEFLWLGTIPYRTHLGLDFNGKSAFVCYTNVIRLGTDFSVIDVGFNEISADCTIGSGIKDILSVSNEYAVVPTRTLNLKVGDEVEYLPDYETLTRVV